MVYCNKFGSPVQLIYLFLFPLFFVMHGYNSYWQLIPVNVLLLSFIKAVLITLAIGAFCILLYTEILKSFVFALFLSFIFFFFGAFHDWVKVSTQFSRLSSYSLMLPTIGALIVIFYYIIRRSPTIKQFFRYCRLLLIFLAGLEVAVSIYKIAVGTAKKNSLAPSIELKMQEIALQNKPDIFFIVFDEYPSSKSLKKDFDFDNRQIDSLLALNHFFVSTDSKSNYNYTFFSLASTLNISYLTADLGMSINENNTLRGIETIKKNYVVDFLGMQQYEIKNIGYFDFEQTSAEATTLFDKAYLENFIDGQTLTSRIKRDILWNFTMKDFFTGTLNIPRSYYLEKQKRLSSNQANFSSLMKELTHSSNKPRFIYAHLLLPHRPYYLDKYGRSVSDTNIVLRQLKLPEAFLGQVDYANKLFKTIISQARGGTRPRVIVIEGDHGYHRFNKQKRSSSFENMNTYYFSDEDYSMLYNGISPVNSFRIILNKYFYQSLPLLKDSSIYILDPDIEKN